jgi:predicted Zn-dependent protease
VARAKSRAQQTGVRGGVRNRDAFLNALDGVIYDDDPKQGIVDGRTFKHPELKIAFTAPQGFVIANGTRAVSIGGSGGQAQFSGGAMPGGGLPAYIETVFRGLAGSGASIPMSEVRTTTVNGIPAAYASARATSANRELDVTVFAYNAGGSGGYHFLTITPAGAGLGPFSAMVSSFGRLTDAQAAAIKPRRIDVVTVKSGDTLTSLAGRMAYADYRLERFLTLNALASNSAIRPGQKVKIIIYG